MIVMPPPPPPPIDDHAPCDACLPLTPPPVVTLSNLRLDRAASVRASFSLALANAASMMASRLPSARYLPASKRGVRQRMPSTCELMKTLLVAGDGRHAR